MLRLGLLDPFSMDKVAFRQNNENNPCQDYVIWNILHGETRIITRNKNLRRRDMVQDTSL
jgi:hypothetical protein